MTPTEKFENGELTIDCQNASNNVLRLDWRGRSTGRRPDEMLSPYLYGIIDRARQSESLVEMHFEALDFFNSSTVAVLVQVVDRARKNGVRLALVYKPTIRWQQLSFEALRVFEQRDRVVQVIPFSAS